MALTIASSASAEVRLVVNQDAPYELEIVVTQNDTILCDTSIEVIDDENWLNDGPGCNLNLSEGVPVTFSGQISSERTSGSFEATFIPVDLASWTGVLRDNSIDFGERLDIYEETLLALDSDLAEFGLKIRRQDIPIDQTIMNAEKSAGAALPAELTAFVTRDISLGDHNFTGPAYQTRWPNRPADWPSLAEQERRDGVPENYLPAEGSDLRAWYDRVRVVFLNIGDGHAPIVWDPQAKPNDPSFFWLHEDDREVVPFLYPDGQPVSAQDALLAPFDWTDDSFIMRDEDNGWILAAIKRAGYDPNDPRVFLFDSSNAQGSFVLSFEQESTLPFFRKVTPYLAFINQSWWPR